MPTAVELLRQGRNEELWQMCCGFLKLSLSEFMDIQRNLLTRQLQALGKCALGQKILRGSAPQTVEEFRQEVPLTTYQDYCPELLEKREDTLVEKPSLWSHSAGKSGEYPCKWVPMTAAFAGELSKALYGVGMLSGCSHWGDMTNIPETIKALYSVAPRPYISGTFADLLRMQSPFIYLPPIEETDGLLFEERIKLGLRQAMSTGFDYFFGLSLILVNIGEKIRQSSDKADLRPFLTSPRALWRLGRGKIRSRLAGRPMLPRDLWSVRGIIGSGVDSLVYKDKIKEFWGRRPLDLYACSEGGVIATQTWDYNGMTFFPQLNFLEFIPEDEQLKLQMDRTYQARTLTLDEVKAGESYEIVITNFHGGIMTRYRIGDMVRIQSRRDDELGIDIPQMTFERRVDDLIDFTVVRVTEKQIWQSLEKAGIAYEDWVAYKIPGQPVLNLLIELKDGSPPDETVIAGALKRQLTDTGKNGYHSSGINEDWRDALDFSIDVTLLPHGAFARYIARRQDEGADVAHLKPPHINPPPEVLSVLTAGIEETIIVTKTGAKAEEEPGAEIVTRA